MKIKLRIALFGVLAFGLYAFVVVPLVRGLTTPNEITLTPAEYLQLAETNDPTVGNDDQGQKYITVKLFGLFPIKRVAVNVLPFDSLLVGGLPVGICGQVDGVIITEASPDGKLQAGDVITAVDGVQIHSAEDFNHQVAAKPSCRLELKRGEKTLSKVVENCRNLSIRAESNGVGILTYVNPANLNYVALGHQLTDYPTGAAVNLAGGELRAVKTYGIKPTRGRETGVIESSIPAHAPAEGSITYGGAFGVTGCFYPDSQILAQTTTSLPVATRYQVHPGAATLRTSLDGESVNEYTCEILKTRYQNRKQDKSMVIRVTDPRLLAETGGIVHGMSGSPIIQDGHLVGALTHAIGRDPTKGYAVYIDFLAA